MKSMFSILLLMAMSMEVLGQSYRLSGNELVVLMREWERANQKTAGADFFKAESYSAYVQGISDTLGVRREVCIPETATVGQIGSVVAKFLNDNPVRLKEPAAILVSDALTKAFPCLTK